MKRMAGVTGIRSLAMLSLSINGYSITMKRRKVNDLSEKVYRERPRQDFRGSG